MLSNLKRVVRWNELVELTRNDPCTLYCTLLHLTKIRKRTLDSLDSDTESDGGLGHGLGWGGVDSDLDSYGGGLDYNTDCDMCIIGHIDL